MRRKIPFLGGMAIIAVVINHASSWGLTAMVWWAHRYRPVVSPNYDQIGTYPYYLLISIIQLALFSVPAFLFISGHFAAYASGGSTPQLRWNFIMARLKHLIWPYLFWSIVIFLIDGLLGKVYSPLDYFLKVLTGKAVSAYFFIPLLIQFYLLAPILVHWVKYFPRLVLILSFIVQMILVCAPYVGGIWGFEVEIQRTLQTLDWVFIRWSFYFVLGIYFGLNYGKVKVWLTKNTQWLLLLTIILGTMSIFESQLILNKTSEWDWAFTPLKGTSIFYAIAFILLFMSFDIRQSTFYVIVKRLGGLSFGIYLIHSKIMELMAKLIYHLFPSLLSQQVLFSLFIAALTVAIYWFMMTLVLESPIRNIHRYIFG